MKQILLVDDDRSDLDHMTSILKKDGFEVTSVDNGVLAYDLLEKKSFDLILIDVKMPSLSGYDFLRLCRAKINHDCPMVFVSVVKKAEVDLKEIDGFIQKPFSDEKFLSVVHKFIK